MDAKQARKLPHLNFSPQEWFFSTRFHSLEARGLLIDLAAIQWMRGGFPNDRASVERLVGVPVSQSVWDEVTPLFVEVESGIGLRWVEVERREAIQRIERAAQSGSKGAKKRYGQGAHSHPIATPKGAQRVPIAILDCTGLDRTGTERTEPNRTKPSGGDELDPTTRHAISEFGGMNSSLNHVLSRDSVVTATWDAIPRRWRKERGLNLAKLAAAIQSEQEQRGCSRTDAARIVGDAIAAYCRSPEGEGRYMRSLGRWLDAEGWREDPESWSVRRGGDGPKGKTLLEVSEELETENRQ